MFNTIACLNEIEGKPGWWKLQNELIFTMTIANVNLSISITIPIGFETNLASTPKWLWWLFPPFGEYNRATILHDYLYTQKVDRFLSDALLRIAMQDTGSPKWKQIAFFYATRLFGRFR